MTTFIPIFPLPIVAFPSEQVNLHIFEPRYVQMINECQITEKPFALVSVIGKRLQEHCTLMQVSTISNQYDSGAMDIKTAAYGVGKILEIIAAIPNKLYSGAIISLVENNLYARKAVQQKTIDALRDFHQKLGISKTYKKKDNELTSYDIAHHIGLSMDQEYEVLALFSEDERMEYIFRHIQRISPNANEQDAIMKRVKLNGEFRNLSLNDFDF